MKNTGVVTELINDKAKVRFIKESACGGNCASCGGCASKPIEIIIDNTLNAKVYDKIEVESNTGKILFSAFVLYILPVLVLILGYAVADVYFNETVSSVMGVIFFLLSFAGVKIYGNKIKNNIKMIRIIEE